MMILNGLAQPGLDSHVSVNALESVGHEIDLIDSDERREFGDLLECLAVGEAPEQAERIRRVQSALGLDQASKLRQD